ncbi:MAG: hypothetical protein ACTSRU_17595, partial [Candidatus Hodarchaeales archaeon]
HSTAVRRYRVQESSLISAHGRHLYNQIKEVIMNMSKRGRSPNDDRSDSMNPNNPSYRASVDNRADQLNPNDPSYLSSRGGSKGKK